MPVLSKEHGGDFNLFFVLFFHLTCQSIYHYVPTVCDYDRKYDGSVAGLYPAWSDIK